MTDATVRTSPPKKSSVPLGVIGVGMSLVVWWPAFTVGAWNTLFFDQLLTIWVASTAALIFVLIERRPVGTRILRAILLLLPSVWLVLSFVVVDTSDLQTFVVTLAALLAVAISSPFTIWVIAHVIWPDLGEGTTRRQRWLVVLVVVAMAVGCFLLGQNQSKFLTCEDFAISGTAQPPGCVHDPDAGDTP